MIDDAEDQEIHDAEDRAEDAELLDPPDEQRTVDAGSRREYRDRQRRQRDQNKARAEFWAAFLANPIGRAELWRIIVDECKGFEERFVCGPTGVPNPEATWFAAGQQAIGLRFYQQMLALDSAGVLLMHQEHDHRFAKPKGKGKK